MKPVFLFFLSQVLLFVLDMAYSCRFHDNTKIEDNQRTLIEMVGQTVRRHFWRRSLSESKLSECLFTPPTTEEQEQDEERMRAWKQKWESEDNSRSIGHYRIPVYFHVIQPTFFIGTMSLSSIDRHISYLNNAFRNVPFEFELERTTTTINLSWANSCHITDVELAFKSELKVGSSDVLNIYVCYAMGDYAGYAYLPSPSSKNVIRDGVVIAYGDGSENTLVHEVGHWAGLYHTFNGNSCDPENEGDRVDDTPQHVQDYESNCQAPLTFRNTCPFIPGMDPVFNFMNYSPYDSCRRQFTAGQIERMVGQFELYRLGDRTLIPTQSPTTPAPTSFQCKTITRLCDADEDCCSEKCGLLFNLFPRCGF